MSVEEMPLPKVITKAEASVAVATAAERSIKDLKTKIEQLKELFEQWREARMSFSSSSRLSREDVEISRTLGKLSSVLHENPFLFKKMTDLIEAKTVETINEVGYMRGPKGGKKKTIVSRTWKMKKKN